MTLLVILLPPRPHAGPDAGARDDATNTLVHVLSPDGMALGSTGRSVASAMPKADTVVAVLPPTDVAWHRVTLPKAPAARLQQALAGVLEEQLLDEPDQTHLALAPRPTAGEPTWVAATHRGWLSEQLAALESAGVTVDRVVPACAPGNSPQGHFFTQAGDDDNGQADKLWLAWSDAHQALSLRTAGGLARAVVPPDAMKSASWTATPAAAAAAERWLGAPVLVRSEAEQALVAARSGWNLRQFDLAARARGVRALRDMGRHMMGASWRPLRWGVVALVLIQVLGLNLWAWQQRRGIENRRAESLALLRGSHPQVRAVLDAPLQMARETDMLRASAGRVGSDDFEALLGQTAAAWPEGRPPVERLRFEPGRLVLPATGWDPAQLQQLRTRLEAGGGKLVASDAELSIARQAPKGQP